MFSSGKHARPTTNPANPILVDYRGNEGHWPIHGYLRSLSAENSWQWATVATPNEVKHARKVLTRLAAFGDLS